MKRIDGDSFAPDLFGAGKSGFREQLPGVSLATAVNAKWFNGIQEAIIRLIEGAGIALSEADYDQFTAAVQWYAAQASLNRVTQGGGAGQIAGLVKIGAAAGETLKAQVDAVDLGTIAFQAWVSAQITSVAEPKFASGTRMLFQQTAAPVGWTKVTTYDNTALRVVSGAVGSGGTVDFTAAFVNGNTGSHVLTLAEIPAHGGHLGIVSAGGTGAEDPQASPNVQSDSLGGGGGHSHTLNLDVKYVDIIIASKD